MLGPKIFFPVQTFRRRPFVLSHNFCHLGQTHKHFIIIYHKAKAGLRPKKWNQDTFWVVLNVLLRAFSTQLSLCCGVKKNLGPLENCRLKPVKQHSESHFMDVSKMKMSVLEGVRRRSKSDQMSWVGKKKVGHVGVERKTQEKWLGNQRQWDMRSSMPLLKGLKKMCQEEDEGTWPIW